MIAAAWQAAETAALRVRCARKDIAAFSLQRSMFYELVSRPREAIRAMGVSACVTRHRV
jgi:hypothetical protein